MGVKPLYWTAGARGVAFASEIRPVQACGFAGHDIGPERLAQYLFYRFVPAPGTVWREVHKVIPGHAIRFAADGHLVHETDFGAPAPAPRRQARPELVALLAGGFREAVARQMLSDVPVGAFLSGGLDSSLVVANMASGQASLPTFAVGFPGEDGLPSELVIAERAASSLGTRHAGRELHRDGYFDRLPWAIAQAEEPVAHPGMLMQADLSAHARAEVKVVLTGQGADEPLGGYPRHHAARVLPLVATVLGGLAGSRALDRIFAGRERLARVRRVLAARPGVERLAALFSPLRPEEAGAMARGCGEQVGREAVLGAIRTWWDRGEGLDDVARTLYVDVRTSLAEDLLLVTDKMSMAHSLEARVPYLDLEYLALLETIPGPHRVGLWGRRKGLQHEVARLLLPGELAKTLAASSSPFRRKRGFDVPVNHWFRSVMGPRLAMYVAGSDSLIPAYVDQRVVIEVTRSYLAGSGDAYRMMLALYVLEMWLRMTVGKVSPEAVAAA